MPSYCGVPQAVGELYNFSPDFQGVPLGEFGARDPRVPNVPTDRSWVQQTAFHPDDSVRKASSQYDVNAAGILAPESQDLQFVRALRGVDTQIDHVYLTYQRNIAAETERINNSLGREMLNSWNDARYNVGGIGYQFDNVSPTGIHWASSPGYKGDAFDPKYNPQIYMRPGVKLAAGFSSIGAVPPGQLPGRQ
jgi:hypothetical protein